MRFQHLIAVPALMLAVLATLDRPAFAQAAAIQERLATARGLTCTFAVMATGTWKDGVPSGSIAAPNVKEITFTNVNVEDGTADAASPYGASLIVVRHTNDYLHLMQMHSAGPLYTTTVLARETKEGRLMAVHTRHEYTDVRLPGFTSRPEMYLGECAIAK
jgi:hypothetical protein